MSGGLFIEQGKDRNGHPAWKVWQGVLVAVIEWRVGEYCVSMRGHMPLFSLAELRQLAEFIEAIP